MLDLNYGCLPNPLNHLVNNSSTHTVPGVYYSTYSLHSRIRCLIPGSYRAPKAMGPIPLLLLLFFFLRITRRKQGQVIAEDTNDELWQRFYLDVVDDKANLARFHSTDATTFRALSDYFHRRVAAQGENPVMTENARFNYVFVINAESLSSLGTMSDEPPRFGSQ